MHQVLQQKEIGGISVHQRTMITQVRIVKSPTIQTKQVYLRPTNISGLFIFCWEIAIYYLKDSGLKAFRLKK